jgi:hypothetical protein
MRRASPALRAAVVLAVACSSTGLISCKSRAPLPVAELIETVGTVENSRAGASESWRAASKGLFLGVGDSLRTAAASNARLRFGKADVVRLGEKGLLRIRADGAQTVPAVEVELGQAEIEGGGTFTIATPHGQARLAPGTRMRILATALASRYEVIVGSAVLDGAMKLNWAAGEGIELSATGNKVDRYKIPRRHRPRAPRREPPRPRPRSRMNPRRPGRRASQGRTTQDRPWRTWWFQPVNHR